MELFGKRKVIVNRAEIAAFNAQWPCSKLDSSRRYWFEFDQDGNLIDCDVPEHSDGREAVAMADDCREWLMNGTKPVWSLEP